ncbi:MAG TPA: ABC transporter substrate-binding protein, partial [Terrimesophilobacter sp.]|nr:ABC transporter substrate-binding protein [Terrimesophilobacter sp.]
MTEKHRKSWTRFASIAAAGIVSIALAITGCSAEPSPAPPEEGGPLLLAADNGSPNFTRNFNPFSGSKRTMVSVIYEPLFVVNSLDGTMTPFLGTEYQQPDAKTIEVGIRPSVTWSDGEDFTAEDVGFTYNLLKEFSALDATGVWQYIDTIDVGDGTVTFHLKEGDVPAASIVLTVPIVPEHIWSSIADPVTETMEDPVGTGPYTLGTFTPTQYTLTKNEDYWQADKVAAPELIIPASNSELEIMSKPYGWAYSFISDVENTWVTARDGNRYWFPPGGTVSVFPNLTKAPFDNVDFRRGLSLSLDRAKIADLAEEGYVEPAGQSGLLLPNQKDWLDPSLPDGGAITQDADAAAD